MNEGIKVLILLDDLNRLKDQLEGCREMIEYQNEDHDSYLLDDHLDNFLGDHLDKKIFLTGTWINKCDN